MVLHYDNLCYTVLYYITLNYTVVHFATLYYIVLHCVIQVYIYKLIYFVYINLTSCEMTDGNSHNISPIRHDM